MPSGSWFGSAAKAHSGSEGFQPTNTRANPPFSSGMSATCSGSALNAVAFAQRAGRAPSRAKLATKSEADTGVTGTASDASLINANNVIPSSQ